MSFIQIQTILRARKWLVFGIALLVIGAVTVASLLLPKRFVATVSIVVDTKSADPLTGAILPLQMLPAYYSTQLDIIRSHKVALKVVDELDLATLPAIQSQFLEATAGQGSVKDWLADQLLEQLEVKPSRDSSMISISYTSGEPAVAASMANAFADAYVATSLELKVAPARQQAGWFDEQVAELRAELEAAQEQLTAYQSAQAVVTNSVDRIDLETAKLAELSSQLVAAQSAMYAAGNRHEQMTDALNSNRVDELPDILGNPLLQSLKADLVRIEAKLADAGSRFGTNHPEYMSIVAERDSLRDEFDSELATARGAIDQTAEMSIRQVDTLEQALDQQKANVLRLNDQRDTLEVLTHELQNARSAYEAAMQRRTHVQLESEINQTDIAILDRAIAPLQPAFPLVTLNLILATVLGVLLGAGTALVRELSDRRLRLTEDLETVSEIPVLAVISRVGRRDRRQARRFARSQSNRNRKAS